MLEVVGAGLGRTGTHSLAEALEIVGFGPCYTILDVEQNLGHHLAWSRAANGELIDWGSLFQEYRSAVDWPTVSFLPAILREFSECKVVLTLRDASSWYESARATIFPGLEASAFHPDPEQRSRSELNRNLILDGVFEGKYWDRDHAITIYRKHNEAVIDLVPENRLLLYRIEEGWSRLCAFLGVEVPNRHFPHRNQRAEFLESAPPWASSHMERAQGESGNESNQRFDGS